jgi:hypothetical protein
VRGELIEIRQTSLQINPQKFGLHYYKAIFEDLKKL